VTLAEPPPLQEGVEGLGQVVGPQEGPELPGGKEVGEEGRDPGGDGLGEGEEEVQQDPHPPFHPPFEVDQAGLPRDLDPGAGDGLVQGLHPVSYDEGEVVPPPQPHQEVPVAHDVLLPGQDHVQHGPHTVVSESQRD